MEYDLDDVGTRLKSARLAAGLTVDDVWFQTRLPVSVVEALEACDFKDFTSPVYAKSFLAQYAGFLDVDVQMWLDALEPGSFMAGSSWRPLVEATEPPEEEAVPAREVRGGWWSVLGLMAITAAWVVAAVKGYEFFELRFGKETEPVSLEGVPDPLANPEAYGKSVTMPSGGEIAGDDTAKPPPRAIIVR